MDNLTQLLMEEIVLEVLGELDKFAGLTLKTPKQMATLMQSKMALLSPAEKKVVKRINVEYLSSFADPKEMRSGEALRESYNFSRLQKDKNLFNSSSQDLKDGAALVIKRRKYSYQPPVESNVSNIDSKRNKFKEIIGRALGR